MRSNTGRMMIIIRLCLMLLASMPASSALSAITIQSASTSQQDEPVRLRADLVVVVVTVVDAAGASVTTLKADDFEILENGNPQKISTFARHDDVPLHLVLVFDISGSVKSRLGFAKDSVVRFLKALVRSDDGVAIVSVSTDVVLEQSFTSDINLLTSTITRLSAKGATALYDGICLAADALSQRQGRRVIFIFSDGRDTISRATLQQTLKVLQWHDVVVYAINTAGRASSANLRELVGERTLETLTQQTGGQVFFPDRAEELDPVLARLAELLRTQYVLGFVSSEEAPEKTYRELVVRVKRPNMQAYARHGYYWSK
ncbi:MAG: VWA domain-containing protein [Acidobacteriota bacterium]|nr:VWA domain-containing protein [Blastocatellia bacterium]MDW8241270.1 VWA domain-containing protein [Acidobacteriota bacterium]